MWNNAKAEGIEEQGMKTMTMHLSLLKNEVGGGGWPNAKFGQCEWRDAEVAWSIWIFSR